VSRFGARPVVACVALALATAMQALAAPQEGDVPVITLPQRSGPRAQAPPDIPALPPAANTIIPMTLRVVTRSAQPGRSQRVVRQEVLRTVDRVLVVPQGTATEWLFVRNAVDPRRVTGHLIDHAEKRIVVYEDSDLRGAHRIRGWLDVLTLHLNADAIARLRAREKDEHELGMPFVRYRADSASADGVVEVWWSAGNLLPLRVITRRAGKQATTSAVEAVKMGVDDARLIAPVVRFPNYREIQVSDSRED
jgi:hypothetical protein